MGPVWQPWYAVLLTQAGLSWALYRERPREARLREQDSVPGQGTLRAARVEGRLCGIGGHAFLTSIL